MSINLTTRMTSACRYTVLVALFSALPTGWAWAEAVSTEPVVVGLAENAGDIPPIIAIDRGFFRAAGLDVRVRAWPAGKQALEAMLAGEVEVATVADTPIVVQSFKRRDFVVIATLAHNNPYRLVARRDRGIRGPSDLRGHRVGVMAGTTTQFFLHSVLADVGLAPGEIAEVDVPAGDLAAALEHLRLAGAGSPDFYAPACNRALVCLRLGEPRAALGCYLWAEAHGGGHLSARARTVTLGIMADQFAAAGESRLAAAARARALRVPRP